MMKTLIYKKTNIPWLTEIPEHWKIWKISRAFRTIGSGTTPESGSPKYYDNGIINWINTGDLNDTLLTECSNKVTLEALKNFTSLKIYPKGSLVVAMYGATIGKVSLLDIEACVNQACCVLNDSNIYYNKYIFYAFLSAKNYIISLGYGGGQPNISQDVIKQLRFPTPPINEQIAISNYLDIQTEKINRFIAAKLRFIELLKEQRQGVINDKLENSGKKIKLKYCVTKIGGGVTPTGGASVYQKVGILFLRSQNIHNDGLRIDDVSFISEQIHADMKSSQLQKNDVLINITGASIGRCYIFEKDCEANINQHVCIIRPVQEIITSEFLMLQLQSDRIQSIINAIEGASREGLTNFEIKNFYLFNPSIEEQIRIIKDVKKETSIINTAISKTEREIELIREYKEAMISEAVMGEYQK